MTAVILKWQTVKPARESGMAARSQKPLGLGCQQVRGKTGPSRVDAKLNSFVDRALLGKLSHQAAEAGSPGHPGVPGGHRHQGRSPRGIDLKPVIGKWYPPRLFAGTSKGWPERFEAFMGVSEMAGHLQGRQVLH